MPTNSRVPRKLPVQRRSSITVEAILEAAIRIFEAQGYRAATTAKVAELAGVSVGSLYQYFPNKLALLAGAKQRFLRGLFLRLEDALNGAKDVESGLRAGIRANLAASREARALLLVCAGELPARLRTGELRPSEAPPVEMLRRFLQKRQAEIADREPGLAALVIAEMVDAVTRAALHDRPEDLKNGVLENELMAAVMFYLRGRTERAGRF